MKKLLFTLFHVCLVGSACHSQGLLDKAKGKISGESNTSETEFVSLDDIASQWVDGAYAYKRRSSGMYEPGGKKNIEFKKGADGKVISIVIDGDEYKTAATASKPFVISYGGRYGALYLNKESIVVYSMRNGDVWVERCYGKKIGINASEKEITAYRAYGETARKEEESAYLANAAEEAKIAEAARLKKFGLEGKEVAKIEIVNLKVPEKFGHFRGFTFDLEATLKDGSVISTASSSEGYLSDYNISYSASNYAAEMFENILSSGFVDTDVITITAVCKSNTSMRVTKDVVLKYNEDISFSYRNGTTSSFGNGGNAMNYRFEVVQVKHAVSGADLLKVRITNVSEGNVVSEFKMGADQTLHFSCNGGAGSASHDQWGIGNGGNGGNITVVKDPSVKYFNFDYSNLGGNPGPNYSAVRGRDGSFKEEVRALKL